MKHSKPLILDHLKEPGTAMTGLIGTLTADMK